MEKTVLNNNIVLVFDGSSTRLIGSIDQDTLKQEAASVYSSLNPNPIQVQMADTQTLFIPEASVNIQLQNNTLLINDQSVNRFNDRKINELVRLTYSLTKKINKPTTAYGFNFLHTISLDNADKIWEKLALFASDNIPAVDGDAAKLIPTLVYKSEDRQLIITIEPDRDPLTNLSGETLNIRSNFHYTKDFSELEVSDIQSLYESSERTISSYIDEVFGDE